MTIDSVHEERDVFARLHDKKADLKFAAEAKQLGEDLQTARSKYSELSNVFDRLEPLRRVVEELNSVLSPEQHDSLRKAARQIQHVGEEIVTCEERSKLRQLPSRFIAAKSAVERIEESLHSAWEEYIRDTFEDWAKLGQVLERLEQTASLGQKMNETSEKGLKLAAAFPPSESELERLKSFQKSVSAMRNDLLESGPGEELVGFLLDVAEQQATLAGVSEDIFEWLRQRDALDLFGVVLR